MRTTSTTETCPTYSQWNELPPHLFTRTQLARQGLRPAHGQRPCAWKTNAYDPEQPYALYHIHDAQPKRIATPAQLAALASARERASLLRHYVTCDVCKALAVPRELSGHRCICWDCAHAEAVTWAQETLAHPHAVVLDTETTNLDGEIIEIAVVTMRGEVLLDTLVRPTSLISPEATAVHGLTHADVTHAPTFDTLYPQVETLLTQAHQIVVWNSDFDYGVLHTTCALAGVTDLAHRTRNRWVCAMEWYAQWYGDWSAYHGNYRWQPLGGGHRAREDCLTVLARLHEMADDNYTDTL
jgi:DNA polymerase III subunit epsilon